MRNIVIRDTLYKWTFRGDRDYACNSSISILTEDRNVKIVIRFKTTDTFTAGSPLNEGMPMLKDGNVYIVNLNQPKYIAEFMSYLLDNGLDLTKKSTKEFDGNKLLLDIGYEDIDHYLL